MSRIYNWAVGRKCVSTFDMISGIGSWLKEKNRKRQRGKAEGKGRREKQRGKAEGKGRGKRQGRGNSRTRADKTG